MKLNVAVAGLVAAAGLLGSASAEAADTKGIAEKGNLFISADRLVPLFSYSYASITREDVGVELTDSRSGSSLSLLWGQNLAIEGGRTDLPNVHTIPRVAFDVTIIPHLTLGAAIAFGFGLGGSNESENRVGASKTTTTTDAPTLSAIGFVPRVGYILPLTDLFAFWPRAGFGIYSMSGADENTTAGVTTTNRLTYTMFSLDLDPQFVIVPVEHFFIHAGPLINIPLTGSVSASRTTGGTEVSSSADASLFNIGLSAGVGGYFNIF